MENLQIRKSARRVGKKSKNANRVDSFIWHLRVHIFFFLFSENCDFSTVSELRRLNSQLEELKSDLKDRDEEIKTLKEQLDSQNKHPVSN